jgi:Zn-dependent protease with chaperone function
MIVSLIEGGAAAWYNPAWLFVRGFYAVFLRISQGASRLQEVLADRWAASTYGSEAFERGLLHIIRRSAAFDAHVNATLSEVLEARRPLSNLYAYAPSSLPSPEDLDKEVRDRLSAKPSPYDSHPAPADRIEWVRKLDAPPASRTEEDEEEAWSLFTDRQALERAMTARVRADIYDARGIHLPNEPAVS